MAKWLTIPKFDKVHTNAELRKKDGEWFWVRIPTTMDSLSRQRLMQTCEGRNAYCVYVHLVSVAAKDPPRGVLADERGPFTLLDLALKTGIPQGVIEDAVKCLTDPSIGWLYWDLNGNEITTALGHSNSSSNSYSERGSAEGENAEGFDAFWLAYPRKVGRAAAKRAWCRHDLDRIAETVMQGLSRCKASRAWSERGGQFVPNPEKWLLREGWIDELDPKDPAKQSASAWESLGAETHRALLEAVQSAEPDAVHSAAKIETQRAMRKLAKQKGLLP